MLLATDEFKACAGLAPKLDQMARQRNKPVLMSATYEFMHTSSVCYLSLICVVFCCMGCCAMASLIVADKRPLFMRRLSNQIKGDYDGG